jgi:hypothetical protein
LCRFEEKYAVLGAPSSFIIMDLEDNKMERFTIENIHDLIERIGENVARRVVECADDIVQGVRFSVILRKNNEVRLIVNTNLLANHDLMIPDGLILHCQKCFKYTECYPCGTCGMVAYCGDDCKLAHADEHKCTNKKIAPLGSKYFLLYGRAAKVFWQIKNKKDGSNPAVIIVIKGNKAKIIHVTRQAVINALSQHEGIEERCNNIDTIPTIITGDEPFMLMIQK